MQVPPVHSSFPHQTGVTERSISSRDRHSTDDIIEDVVIGHRANRVSAGIGSDTNRYYHLRWIELGLADGFESCSGHWMKHPLEIVDARHDRRRAGEHAN